MNRRWVLWMVLGTAVGPGSVVAQLPPLPKQDVAEKGPQPRLYVPERMLDLGSVLEGDKRILRWRLENHGDADLIIERAKASCGCTVVKLSDEDKVIPPGGFLELKAEFDSTRRRGPQSKHVLVFSNAPAEPKLKLAFKANVEVLFEIKPAGVLNLRAVQRGEAAGPTLDLLPGDARRTVEVLDVAIPEDLPLRVARESQQTAQGLLQRLRFSATEDAPIGRLKGEVAVTLRVGDIERTRRVSIRGEVVGDITWQPKVVDVTRQLSMPGKRLAPVTLRSVKKRPFEVIGVSVGPPLEAAVEAGAKAPKGTLYKVYLTIRDDAAPGPFGARLEVRTNSLDQPVVLVPVFGVVPPPVEVDPPIVLLKQDGTAVGRSRRLKLRALPQRRLDILDAHCASDGVVATIDREASARVRHLCYLDVRLTGTLPEGTHETVLTVTTSLKGAERLEIPVTVYVPG